MTDQELKLQLARLLPDHLYLHALSGVCWKERTKYCQFDSKQVEETEWLHVCWLIEQTLTVEELDKFIIIAWKLKIDKINRHLLNQDEVSKEIWRWLVNLSWQQRALAILKMKGLL